MVHPCKIQEMPDLFSSKGNPQGKELEEIEILSVAGSLHTQESSSPADLES